MTHENKPAEQDSGGKGRQRLSIASHWILLPRRATTFNVRRFCAYLKMNNKFDLAIRCQQLSLASLATELLLRATALPDFIVYRSGDDSDSVVRFMVIRTAGRVGYAAEFILHDEELVAAYISSPSDWSASERATACVKAFAELFSAVRTSDGGHVTVSTVPRSSSVNDKPSKLKHS